MDLPPKVFTICYGKERHMKLTIMLNHVKFSIFDLQKCQFHMSPPSVIQYIKG